MACFIDVSEMLSFNSNSLNSAIQRLHMTFEKYSPTSICFIRKNIQKLFFHYELINKSLLFP